MFKNCQFLKIPFKQMFSQQIKMILITIIIALLSKYLLSKVSSGLFQFLISGVVYTSFCGLVIWKFPRLAGLKGDEVSTLFKGLKSKIGQVS